MDDIYYEKVLNRIIQGRLRLRLGDLVLFIYEPDQDVIELSFDVYDEYYKRAYYSGVYVDQEIVELLLDNDLWSPLDDKKVEEIRKQIEEVKIEAFKNFYSKRNLAGIKRQLRQMETTMIKYQAKKKQLDHVTCKGVANFARKSWLISKTTELEDGSKFDFVPVSVATVMDAYADSTIYPEVYRKIARSEPWRTMWISSKKRGDAFGKASCQLDSNQLSLVSYSCMYDSVYESSDSPKDEVIQDDDCLDGWFIVQHRKYEKDKKQSEVDAMLTNPKIANSSEIFLMANDQEGAQEIYGLNNPHARNTIQQRRQQIKEADGNLSFADFADVKRDNQMSQVRGAKTKMGGKK